MWILFLRKNIQKTAEAYEKMSSVQPGLTYSDAADAWSDSALADVIVPGLLLFLGWAIFSRKRKEAGLYQLLGSTKRGHLEMALAKTIVYFFFAVLLAICYMEVRLYLPF